MMIIQAVERKKIHVPGNSFWEKPSAFAARVNDEIGQLDQDGYDVLSVQFGHSEAWISCRERTGASTGATAPTLSGSAAGEGEG